MKRTDKFVVTTLSSVHENTRADNQTISDKYEKNTTNYSIAFSPFLDVPMRTCTSMFVSRNREP